MDKRLKYIIVSLCCVGITVVSSSAFLTPVSGYQSMTAEWYQVVWPNAQTGTTTFTKSLSGSTFNWNPDATGIDSNGAIPDGTDDLSTVAGECENPKFDHHPDGDMFYNDWWINDTVSASNPTGEAKHYEWAIDIYTMNINFYAIGGAAYFINPPQIWLELQNNYDSVFSNLGAEAAVSYVIYAQTEEYTWTPESAGWHTISPAVGNFEFKFLDGSTAIPPGVPEEDSDLNFANLQQYSDVAIPFTLTQFGKDRAGSAPTVNMVIELNILTLGRFDYVLIYEAGGENQIAPIGELGILDSIGAALGAGFGALMDGFAGLGDSLVAPVVAICVMAGLVMVIIVILRRK